MEYKRGRKGSTGGAVLYVTMAVAFVLIAVITAMALFFKITEIRVEGAVTYTADRIITASGIERDTSVFFLNASSAQRGIRSALPYVDTVKVTRKLPGTVVITVTETSAAAYAASGGKYYLFDVTGRILEETSSVPAVTELRGAVPVEPAVGKSLSFGQNESVRLRALTQVLGKAAQCEMLGRMAWIDVTNLSAVTFDYNGYLFNIGAADELDMKFDTLISGFLAKNPDPGNGRSVYYDAGIAGLRF